MKTEFDADMAVFLCPKMYNLNKLGLKPKQKSAHKGINLSSANEKLLTFKNYFDTLFEPNDEPVHDLEAENRGIRYGGLGERFPFTYKQMKKGLSRLAPKWRYFPCRAHAVSHEIFSDEELCKKIYPYTSCTCSDSEGNPAPKELWTAVLNRVKEIQSGNPQTLMHSIAENVGIPIGDIIEPTTITSCFPDIIIDGVQNINID